MHVVAGGAAVPKEGIVINLPADSGGPGARKGRLMCSEDGLVRVRVQGGRDITLQAFLTGKPA